MKRNKGYTMIEMIIVITIMAILSGLAAVSVGLIRKAKIQDAVTTFDSQLTNLWMSTKSISSDQKTMKAQLTLESSTDSITGAAQQVYVWKITDGTTEVSKTTYDKWYKYVTIKYKGAECDTTGWTIQFDKSTGAVVAGNGSGDYVFEDKSGKEVATVHLDAVTGNHYIK